MAEELANAAGLNLVAVEPAAPMSRLEPSVVGLSGHVPRPELLASV